MNFKAFFKLKAKQKLTLTRVLYKLISPSKPLRLCSNFTIGTLAVVIGKMFLKPGEATL